MADETLPEKKEEPVKIPTYQDKIEGLLSRVSKGEVIFPKPAVVEPPKENEVYKKMKEMGGLQKGLPELFKLEESAFDIPHYVTEENDTLISGTYHKVNPPSSHKDADEYWAKLLPKLKHIGKVKPHEGEQPGQLEMDVINSEGEEETLKIMLVRDESKGERPTLAFSYTSKDEIKPEEVVKYVHKCGLKADRLSAKSHKNVIFLDVLES